MWHLPTYVNWRSAFFSGTAVTVDPTQEGIPATRTDEFVAEILTIEEDESSETEENLEIMELEKRAFDDHGGIFSDQE